MIIMQRANWNPMAKALAALLCCLVATAASAYPILRINRYIVGFADSQAGVIKLVIGNSVSKRPPTTQIFYFNDDPIEVERTDSAWEYQRPRNAGKVELILRRVPENDNQVVIDFNGNSRIEQRAGILLEVVGSEETMGFDWLLDWMATEHGTHESMANTFPSFSPLNVLASDAVNGLIVNNLNSQFEAGDHLHSLRISIPVRLSMDTVISTPYSADTIVISSDLCRPPLLPESPSMTLHVITQPSRPGYNIHPENNPTSPNLPLPVVESYETVSVNIEYVDRERLDDIIRRGAGRHEALPEARSSTPHSSPATTYFTRLQQWFYRAARWFVSPFSVNSEPSRGLLEPPSADLARARNDFYRQCIFQGGSSGSP